MNTKFSPKDKVVICNSMLNKDNDSYLKNFVCYGVVKKVSHTDMGYNVITKVKAIGQDGVTYKYEEDYPVIYFLSKEEYLARLELERVLHPERIYEINSQITELKKFFG